MLTKSPWHAVPCGLAQRACRAAGIGRASPAPACSGTDAAPPPRRSVRMSLVPEAEQRARWPGTAGPFRPYAAVQLRARHWVMRSAAGAVTNEVRGEGVIGQYPTLRPGADRAPRRPLARAPAPRATARGPACRPQARRLQGGGRARPRHAQALSGRGVLSAGPRTPLGSARSPAWRPEGSGGTWSYRQIARAGRLGRVRVRPHARWGASGRRRGLCVPEPHAGDRARRVHGGQLRVRGGQPGAAGRRVRRGHPALLPAHPGVHLLSPGLV
jgi:hypothetical protein